MHEPLPPELGQLAGFHCRPAKDLARVADQDQLGMVVQEAVDGGHGRDVKSVDLKQLQIREQAKGRWKDVVR